jgi:glycosyltransferase involved in cell wall biosynthesis
VPLVSVVTATYSGDDPALLARSIDSVIAQDHRPLELHVVCDGPVPGTSMELLLRRASQHPWINVHQHSGRRGPAAARNSVLPRCRGAYVAVLDADDAMSPRRISRQVEYLERHGVDIVASWLDVVDADGAPVGVRRFPESWQAVRRQAPFSCPTANTAMLVRSAVLPRFRYPEKLTVGEDYRLWVRLLRQGVRIANIPEPLTRYRTGVGYFGRRRGWPYAVSDLGTKLRALPLAPWWQWPLVMVGAGATFAVRLLPDRLFQLAYEQFERAERGARA